jgi:hypothetical protein
MATDFNLNLAKNALSGVANRFLACIGTVGEAALHALGEELGEREDAFEAAVKRSTLSEEVKAEALKWLEGISKTAIDAENVRKHLGTGAAAA